MYRGVAVWLRFQWNGRQTVLDILKGASIDVTLLFKTTSWFLIEKT